MKTDPRIFDVFFADLLLPLHRSNCRHDVHYFALKADASKDTYWEPAIPRSAGGIERLRIGEGDGAALLARLADYWAETGESLLSQLQPDMETLWQTLMESDDDIGETPAEVPVTVYPLF